MARISTDDLLGLFFALLIRVIRAHPRLNIWLRLCGTGRTAFECVLMRPVRRLCPSAAQAALLLLAAMQTDEHDENLQVVRLKGEIDLAASPELRESLQQHARAKCPALVLDFREVSYIDTSGLATIVEYLKHARAFDGRVALAHLSEQVRTIFELVRLHEFLPIYSTVAEASAALRKKPSA